MINDDFEWFSLILCIIGFLMGIGYFVCSIEEAKQNTAIEALNKTLQYDTLSLDKNGKLLEIKIK